MAVLVRDARIVVTNDTGMSHLAAALATPSVVICSGADPARFAPADSTRHRVLSVPIACRPCMHAECPIGHPCALAISVEQVLQTIASLLQDAGATAPSLLQGARSARPGAHQGAQQGTQQVARPMQTNVMPPT